MRHVYINFRANSSTQKVKITEIIGRERVWGDEGDGGEREFI